MHGLVYRIISIIFPFIIRTITINVLSSEYLGLSSLFTSILQALNLMEVGIGSALIFNIYEPVAKNDTKKICNYLAYYKKCYRVIGSLILIIGIAIMPFIKTFINGTYPSEINIYIIYFIYLINTVFSYWLFAYKNSVALAYQRTDVESRILSISQSLLYISQIIILLLIKNYYIYIIMLPIFTIVKNILVSLKIDKLYPDIRTIGTITSDEKNKVKSNVKALFGHQVFFTVINSADNIILSAFLGLTDLAIYNNYYYILSSINNIFTILFNSIQAGIGNSIILDKKEDVFENYKRFRLFIYMAACICSACLFCLYQPFMNIWMGESLMLNDICVLIFTLGFYVTQVRRVVTTYKNAAGMWSQDFLKPYVVILVDIILNVILIPRIGSIGAMLSTIISICLIAIPWENYVLYRKLYKMKLSEQYIFIFKEVFVLIISLIACKYITNYIIISGFLGLIIKLILTILISLLINLIMHFRTPELNWIKNRLIIFIKTKK